MYIRPLLFIYACSALVLLNDQAVLDASIQQFSQLESDTALLQTAVAQFNGTDDTTSPDTITLTQKVDRVIGEVASLTNLIDIARNTGVNASICDGVGAFGLEYFKQYLGMLNTAFSNEEHIISDITRVTHMNSLNTAVIALLREASLIGGTSYDSQYLDAQAQLNAFGTQAYSYIRAQVARPSITTRMASTSTLSRATRIATIIPTTATIVKPSATSFALQAIQTGSVFTEDDTALQTYTVAINGEEIYLGGPAATFTLMANGSLSTGGNLVFSNILETSNFHSSTPTSYNAFGNPQYSSSNHPGNSLLQVEPQKYLPDLVGQQVFSITNNLLSMQIGGAHATFYRCYTKDGSYLYAIPPYLTTTTSAVSCYKVSLQVVT